MTQPQQTSPATLSGIHVYPIKSIRGIELSSAWVEKQGLSFDRRLMLATSDGVMVTARKYPQLVLVKAALTSTGLVLTYPGKESLHLEYANFKMQPTEAVVWSDSFTAYTVDDVADEWFSDLLEEQVALLYTGQDSNRLREKLGHNVSFADGYPLLIISQASLDALNARSTEVHKMAQFRPNIVVSGTEAFAEDSWKRFKVGDVEFEVMKPCERCILTTIETNSGKKRANREPLKTLGKFRANEFGQVFFGQNVRALNEGVIEAGAEVEVLEYQEPVHYRDQELEAVQVSQLTIVIDGVEIEGNNRDPLLNQAEAQGVKMRSSCRSGLCGACKVKVTEGQVKQPDAPAITDDEKVQGFALACCCVPETNISVQA
ncbi:MOSC domain-containing protein [Vibrio astriarenae]|uniref:MOSC domain-containing protein n=1 Tax=Vibrio astriarenae TaxID=1481923 RepID=A0A7Z2T6I7_9VIBR|nr:YcbX family protein [Vibrio astriarenae]QIA65309.1 MOSC domain-containing protein [Vibrio astriarenae]